MTIILAKREKNMEVVEKIKNENEELEKNQVTNLFKSIIMGKEVLETIKTSRGDFVVKFPRTRDIEAIGRLTAYRLNGIPAKCFDAQSYSLMQQVATLDIIVVKGPAWYELAKKENVNFGWQEIPSISFIQEVYALALQFREKVQDEIERNPKPTDREVAEQSTGNTSIEPGLFDGLSG